MLVWLFLLTVVVPGRGWNGFVQVFERDPSRDPYCGRDTGTNGKYYYCTLHRGHMFAVVCLENASLAIRYTPFESCPLTVEARQSDRHF